MLDYVPMSQNPGDLYAIYVEGETKTGKGAASTAVANALKDQGFSVYYDVAGDFFRRYVAITRLELGLTDDDVLPPRAELEVVAAQLYANGRAFDVDLDLGDLQRSAISQSVSLLGELPVAQKAASDWYGQSVKQAVESGAQVLVLDGRNPRRHVERHVKIPDVKVITILDIYMTCEPEVAARRVLLSDGIDDPSVDQLKPIVANIAHRRALDRTRAEWPFWWPETHLAFVPGKQSPTGAIESSWACEAPPLPIVIDNSYVPKPVMWQAVADLAIGALQHSR